MADLTMDQICSMLKAWSDAAMLVRDARNGAVKTAAESKRIIDEANSLRDHAKSQMVEAKQSRAEAESVLAQARTEAQRLVVSGQAEADRILATAMAQKERIEQAVKQTQAIHLTLKNQTAAMQVEHDTVHASLSKARKSVEALLSH